MHLQTEFVVAEQLFELFANRGWNIYKAMSGQFVTCDRPVVLMWDKPMRTEPVGLGVRGSRALFAQSSENAICVGFELKNRALEIDADEVAKINGRIILHANRQVYARQLNAILGAAAAARPSSHPDFHARRAGPLRIRRPN